MKSIGPDSAHVRRSVRLPKQAKRQQRVVLSAYLPAVELPAAEPAGMGEGGPESAAAVKVVLLTGAAGIAADGVGGAGALASAVQLVGSGQTLIAAGGACAVAGAIVGGGPGAGHGLFRLQGGGCSGIGAAVYPSTSPRGAWGVAKIVADGALPEALSVVISTKGAGHTIISNVVILGEPAKHRGKLLQIFVLPAFCPIHFVTVYSQGSKW